MSELKPETRALLRQAQDDRAPAATRKAMWRELERALPIAPAAATLSSSPTLDGSAHAAATKTAAAVSASTSVKASFWRASGSARRSSLPRRCSTTARGCRGGGACAGRRARATRLTRGDHHAALGSDGGGGDGPARRGVRRACAPRLPKVSPKPRAGNALPHRTRPPRGRLRRTRAARLTATFRSRAAAVRAARNEEDRLESRLPSRSRALRSLNRDAEAARVEARLRSLPEPRPRPLTRPRHEAPSEPCWERAPAPRRGVGWLVPERPSQRHTNGFRHRRTSPTRSEGLSRAVTRSFDACSTGCCRSSTCPSRAAVAQEPSSARGAAEEQGPSSARGAAEQAPAAREGEAQA